MVQKSKITRTQLWPHIPDIQDAIKSLKSITADWRLSSTPRTVMRAWEIRRADRGDGNERAVSERLPARVVEDELIDNTARVEEEEPEPCASQLIVNVNTVYL